MSPWQLFTAGSLWDASHRAPQQGRSGALDDDLLAAVIAAVDQLNSRPAAGSGDQQRSYTAKDLLDGRYRHRPGLGTEYVLSFAGRQPERLETARLTRPVGALSVASSVSPAAATIRLVVPYYHRPKVFGAFLANVAHLVLEARESLQLLVVFYWRGTPAVELSAVQRDRALVAEALRQLNWRAGRPVAKLLDQKRTFSRGHALLCGAEDGGDDGEDVLLFFLDVDMFVDTDALRRCRSNASPGRSVYYPIVFSTFDPALRALAWGKRKVSLWKEHPVDPDVGFWRDFGYGMTCQFRSDFRRVAGDYLVSDSWGGEDEKLFKRHRATGIEIVRAPDPGLVHVHHASRCDRSQTGDKHSWCEGSQMITEASPATWALATRQMRERLRLAETLKVNPSLIDGVCEKCFADALEIFPAPA